MHRWFTIPPVPPARLWYLVEGTLHCRSRGNNCVCARNGTTLFCRSRSHEARFNRHSSRAASHGAQFNLIQLSSIDFCNKFKLCLKHSKLSFLRRSQSGFIDGKYPQFGNQCGHATIGLEYPRLHCIYRAARLFVIGLAKKYRSAKTLSANLDQKNRQQ
jgi:hypothetical protein